MERDAILFGVLINSCGADESKNKRRLRKSFVLLLVTDAYQRTATQRLGGSQLEDLSRPFKRQIMFLFS